MFNYTHFSEVGWKVLIILPVLPAICFHVSRKHKTRQHPSQNHKQACHFSAWEKGRNGDSYIWVDSKIRKEF
jgi:hypothetical protein